MDIVFQRKKQNSNRVRGVEVLSNLAEVKYVKDCQEIIKMYAYYPWSS
jgi:hypothetical protein